MTLDGFLTFLTLLAGVYAFLSNVDKLRIQLHATFHIAFSAVALIATLYLLFFDELGRSCPHYFGNMCGLLVFDSSKFFKPAEAAFLITLIWATISIFVHHKTKPSIRSLPKIQRLVDQLLLEERFVELVELLKPYLKQISDAGTRKLFFQNAHDQLRKKAGKPSTLEEFLETSQGSSQKKKTSNSKIERTLSNLVLLFVPNQKRLEETANTIADELLSNKQFARTLALHKPYEAFSYFKFRSYYKDEFFTQYMKALITNNPSIFYKELGSEVYEAYASNKINPRNKLLCFLFDHIENTEYMRAWKPVGDQLLAMLESDEHEQYQQRLTKPVVAGYDEYKLSDPIYIGLSYFDVMISSAHRQGETYHMWLYYVEYVVRELVALYDTSNNKVDITDEFPILASHLIYEALSKLRAWMLFEINTKKPEKTIRYNEADQPTDIPTAAARAFARSLQYIIKSNAVDDKFATYMHEVFMQGVVDLDGHQRDGMQTYLISAILFERYPGLTNNDLQRLQHTYENTRSSLIYDTYDYGDAIKQAVSNATNPY